MKLKRTENYTVGSTLGAPIIQQVKQGSDVSGELVAKWKNNLLRIVQWILFKLK